MHVELSKQPILRRRARVRGRARARASLRVFDSVELLIGEHRRELVGQGSCDTRQVEGYLQVGTESWGEPNAREWGEGHSREPGGAGGLDHLADHEFEEDQAFLDPPPRGLRAEEWGRGRRPLEPRRLLTLQHGLKPSLRRSRLRGGARRTPRDPGTPARTCTSSGISRKSEDPMIETTVSGARGSLSFGAWMYFISLASGGEGYITGDHMMS
jgi:hypothetical protein